MASTALWKPKLLMTVVTIVPWFKRFCSAKYFAQIYIILSPSTMFPNSSTAMTRSPSPSNARPASAPFSTTNSANASGCVEPTPSLMFNPSGEVPIVKNSVSRSANSRLTLVAVAPFAASTQTVIPSKSSGIV